MPKGTGSLYKKTKAGVGGAVTGVAGKSAKAVQGIMEEAAGRVTGTAGPKGPVKKAQTSNPIPQDDIQDRAYKRDVQATKNMARALDRNLARSNARGDRNLKNTLTGRTTTRQFLDHLDAEEKRFDKDLARVVKAREAGAFHEALPALPARKKKSLKATGASNMRKVGLP